MAHPSKDVHAASTPQAASLIHAASTVHASGMAHIDGMAHAAKQRRAPGTMAIIIATAASISAFAIGLLWQQIYYLPLEVLVGSKAVLSYYGFACIGLGVSLGLGIRFLGTHQGWRVGANLVLGLLAFVGVPYAIWLINHLADVPFIASNAEILFALGWLQLQMAFIPYAYGFIVVGIILAALWWANRVIPSRSPRLSDPWDQQNHIRFTDEFVEDSILD